MSNILRLYNSKYDIVDQQAVDIALGCLLGDGTITKSNKVGGGRMIIDQSEKDYVEWKKSLFVKHKLASEVSKIQELERKRGVDENNQPKFFKSYRFYSFALFHDWRNLFYDHLKPGDLAYNPNKKLRQRKQFIPELLDLFKNPITFAIFYMDDGGCSDNQPYFATGEVTNQEVLIMQKVFKQNFDLDTSLRTVDGHHKGLLVRRKDCGKFLDLVEQYVSQVPGMSRKLKITRP